MTPSSSWLFAGAAVVGNTHEKNGRECEDAWKSAKTDLTICLCVSDGCGSAAQPRIGAVHTAQRCSRYLADHFERLFAADDDSAKSEIFNEIKKHLERVARRKKHQFRDYACTLVALVLHRDGRWMAIHLGDGGIIGLFETGLSIISEPQKGEYANVTFFVTDLKSEQEIVLVRGDLSGEKGTLRGFVLFSDGVEMGLIDFQKHTAAPAVEKIINYLADNGASKTQKELKKTLTETFRRRTGDDCTLAVCVVPD